MLLTPAILRTIKRNRARRWIQPFTIVQLLASDADDADVYDEPAVASGMTVSIEASGDYVWRDQFSARGTPGGVIPDADLVLCTDIAHTEDLLFSGARLVVEDTTLAITSVTAHSVKGEVVVAARKAR